MEIVIIAHTYEDSRRTKKLDYFEYRFASGLSLFTETFQGLSKEGKAKQHAAAAAAVENLRDAGFKITIDLNGLNPFS